MPSSYAILTTGCTIFSIRLFQHSKDFPKNKNEYGFWAHPHTQHERHIIERCTVANENSYDQITNENNEIKTATKLALPADYVSLVFLLMAMTISRSLLALPWSFNLKTDGEQTSSSVTQSLAQTTKRIIFNTFNNCIK